MRRVSTSARCNFAVDYLVDAKPVIDKIDRRSRRLLCCIKVEGGGTRRDESAKVPVEDSFRIERNPRWQVRVVDDERRDFVVRCGRRRQRNGRVDRLEKASVSGSNIHLS